MRGVPDALPVFPQECIGKNRDSIASGGLAMAVANRGENNMASRSSKQKKRRRIRITRSAAVSVWTLRF